MFELISLLLEWQCFTPWPKNAFAYLGELCNWAVNEDPSVFLVPFDWVKVAAVFPVDGAGQGHLATITGLDLLSYHTCNQQMKVNNKYLKLAESIIGKKQAIRMEYLIRFALLFPWQNLERFNFEAFSWKGPLTGVKYIEWLKSFWRCTVCSIYNHSPV